MAAAAAFVAHKKKLEREGSEDVQSVFDQYDKDGSGDINTAELRTALAKLNVVVTEAQLKKVMAKFGGVGASSLNIQQFDDLVVLLRKKQEEVKALSKWKYDLDVPVVVPQQELVRKAYTHPVCVWSVAAIILANFLVNIIEKEVDPGFVLYTETWLALDAFFNIVFLIELLVNMYGYGGPRALFWKNFWNVFDTIIVTVGVLLMSGAIPPESPLANLKMLRAFRVFRLFKRIKSLNKIIVALAKAIPGVANAFIIMLIFFCIYAILAVELFSGFGTDGTYITYDDDGSITVSSMTARGLTNGFEYYGTFSRALYTLFQVMTGESWSEAVARPLLFGFSNDGNAVTAAIFFVSFIILTQMILVNVVVAVLLDKFVTDEEEEEPEIDAEELLEGYVEGSFSEQRLPREATKKLGTDAKLELLIQQVAILQKTVDALARTQPQPGEVTPMFTADVRNNENQLRA